MVLRWKGFESGIDRCDIKLPPLEKHLGDNWVVKDEEATCKQTKAGRTRTRGFIGYYCTDRSVQDSLVFPSSKSRDNCLGSCLVSKLSYSNIKSAQ